MSESKRMHRCCFTGHRPEKLTIAENEVREKLTKAINDAISDGFTTFITGMARGVDMWAAEIVISIKENDDRIKLICASPFIDFEKNWTLDEQNRYKNIMEKADYIKFVCKDYSRNCFQIRNEYMVNNSGRVIAVFNGERGGTLNTIKYAKRKSCEVVNVIDTLEM